VFSLICITFKHVHITNINFNFLSLNSAEVNRNLVCRINNFKKENVGQKDFCSAFTVSVQKPTYFGSTNSFEWMTFNQEN